MPKFAGFVLGTALALTPLAAFAAVSPANITTVGSSSGLSSYTTSSGAPGANRLELIFVGSQVSSGTANIPTVSGDGLTWVQVATQLSGDNLRRGTLFRAMGSSPSSGALTIDFGGQTQVRAGWSWGEFSGVDTTGTNGSGAVVQSAAADNNLVTDTGMTVSLAAFSNVNNATYGAIRFGTNVGGALTPGSGFSQLGISTATNKYQSEYQLSNNTSVSWTWPSEATYSEAVVVEIKAGIPQTATPMMVAPF